MYTKRLKLLVALAAFFLLVCLGRLAQMQLLSGSYYRRRIAELQNCNPQQLPTIRGKILDRKGNVAALDEPQFKLCVSYELTSLMDKRCKNLKGDFEDLENVIYKLVRFYGVEQEEVNRKIQNINNYIWNLRRFMAWRRNCPNSELLEEYTNVFSVPLSKAIAEFKSKFPDEGKRLLLVNKVDIAEMHRNWPLLDLRTQDDVLAGQLKFLDVNGIKVRSVNTRVYPYTSAAAQTIGWVGLPQPAEKKLFATDRLLRYLPGEVCGSGDGVEFVYEFVLRGKRGEVVYNIDHELVNRTEREFGKDVRLTLDIELQQRVEKYLADCSLNRNCNAPTAAVVIDVKTADTLALVSMPVFDLNRIRQRYTAVVADTNEPLRNHVINKLYPPGSVIKPLILIAGLESGKITPEEIISCPYKPAPKGWPNCFIFNNNSCHDWQWADEGENNTRNAIKGSCNIYFSKLANRIQASVLQSWLFRFGCGRKILHTSALAQGLNIPRKLDRPPKRNLRQLAGVISSSATQKAVSKLAGNSNTKLCQLPSIRTSEKKLFGIGQGNLRVTPLQVANAMAAIARGGFYKSPRLFIGNYNETNYESVDLNISRQTLAVVRDGMNAVVNEHGGTAYKEFQHSGFAAQGVKVYGKTGSPQKPDNAWFAGFAEDSQNRSIAIAVVVEGGQHGSSDAAPLARDIIQFCIDAGYIGTIQTTAN